MDKFVVLLIQFFVRGIWESALFLFGTLYIADTNIPKKKYLIASLCFGIAALLIRELPISYGIHTMIILICLNLIAILVFQVNLEQSIKSSVIVTCVLFALEGLNGIILQLIFGADEFKLIIGDQVRKVLYFIPSTILFVVFTVILYFVLRKKRKGVRDARTAELQNCR